MKFIVFECALLFLLAQHGNSIGNHSEYIPEIESSSENITESEDDNYSSTESQQSDVEVFNITDVNILRFATPCETPRHEITYCVEINKCQVLKNVHGRKKYAAYVEASRCGPSNENKKYFKVCCGKYNNFRNVSNSIDDVNVLPKKCGIQNIIMRGRIFGGENAALKEYPWMARILHKNIRGIKSYGCAGFLIHAKYVITAGHCIKSSSIAIRGEPYSVVLGEHDTNNEKDCSSGNKTCADPLQQSRIVETVVHPQYNETSKNHHNDIAIIHLKKAVTFTDYVQPICLLSEDLDIAVKKFYISGWGRTETSDTSSIKLKLSLPPFDDENCQRKYKQVNLEIDNTQICAGGEKRKDSCAGDSGGPLMIRDESAVHYAAGLVSYGIGCGLDGWPGVYTKIASYLSWIKTEMLRMSAADREARLSKKLNRKNKKSNLN